MDNDLLISRMSFYLLRSPARVSILGFTLLIAVGTALLMLPQSAAGSPMGFVDALFMSTSASCVTGTLSKGKSTRSIMVTHFEEVQD